MTGGLPTEFRLHLVSGYQERITTGFFKSSASTVLGKHFPKSQQIPCSRSGEHLLPRTGPHVLDSALDAKFQSRHTALFNSANSNRELERAAVWSKACWKSRCGPDRFV